MAIVTKSEVRSRADREADNQQLLLLEEKDVISTVATVLSDLCGPGDWMPMDKLRAEVSLSISLTLFCASIWIVRMSMCDGFV
ncbi:hypothetical protein COCNU_scaffold008759G000030 [Cocos nucifera]|nr:hypothetical protein [Cocos nucifera]